MTPSLTTLDAHQQPSDELRATWKAYSKTSQADLEHHAHIAHVHSDLCLSGHIPSERLAAALDKIRASDQTDQIDQTGVKDAPIYIHQLLPGATILMTDSLLVIPSLIPPSTQKALLSSLIHRHLSNPAHQTNLHLHYDLPYQKGEGGQKRSFFSLSPDSSVIFAPKDPQLHRELSVKQVMDRRLSWLTLGGQYDWTNRQYPDQEPPEFPPDMAAFLHTLFPETEAQAAIVNFYTPGDTMMMHRDVSEMTNKGLISLSIGCDALFMIAPDPATAAQGSSSSSSSSSSAIDAPDPKPGPNPHLLLRLCSGDAIYMSEESRYAWHGVPKVLAGTCPDFLADWPAEDGEEGEEGGEYEGWRGWMGNKRININVRQVRD